MERLTFLLLAPSIHPDLPERNETKRQVSARIRADLLKRAKEFNIKLEDVSIVSFTSFSLFVDFVFGMEGRKEGRKES